MDLTDWQRLYDRLDCAHRACVGTSIGLDQAHRNTIGSRFGVREFWTMHRAVQEKLNLANSEWVNCRRRGRGSIQFDQLLADAEEAVKNFEGYVMLSKLMHKEQK